MTRNTKLFFAVWLVIALALLCWLCPDGRGANVLSDLYTNRAGDAFFDVGDRLATSAGTQTAYSTNDYSGPWGIGILSFK